MKKVAEKEEKYVTEKTFEKSMVAIAQSFNGVMSEIGGIKSEIGGIKDILKDIKENPRRYIKLAVF